MGPYVIIKDFIISYQSAEVRTLALHKANLSSIPKIPDGPCNPQRAIPECRARNRL